MVQVGIQAIPGKVEPDWVWQAALKAYSRPLLGSELVKERMHAVGMGAPEPCHGFSFKTTCTAEQLVPLLHEALGRLRFKSPTIASSIEDQRDDHKQRVWVYKPAANSQEVEDWIKETLSVQYSAPSDDDFLTSICQTRMPYEDGRFPKLLECHLLMRDTGVQSLFLHGSHAILDAIPTLGALHALFQSVSRPDSETYMKDLPWGEEWQNLPAGPINSTGGPQPNAEVEVPQLIREVANTVNREKMSESIQSQRSEIQIQGLPVRVHNTINAENFSKIKARLKEHGLTVTVLLEAAFILAIFIDKAKLGELDEHSHVILDMGLIALNKFFVPPHNVRTHFSSSLCYVPLVVDYKDLPGDVGSKDQLIVAMRKLKAQYNKWVGSRHLPWLSYQWVLPSNPNPRAIIITNMAVIEQYIPLTFYDSSAKPVIELIDMALSHRLSTYHRQLIHVWSMHDELHVQIVAQDVWDKEVLQEFLDKAMELSTKITSDG